MMDFLKQLPHLELYGNPIYFVYIVLAVLPIFVGLFFKKLGLYRPDADRSQFGAALCFTRLCHLADSLGVLI